MEIVVSPDGLEMNDGTATSPLPLKIGLAKLKDPGDVLSLRGGTYLDTVDLQKKKGTSKNPIVIRSFPGEHAVLDGATLAEFGVAPNNAWEPLGNGEFQSVHMFERNDDDRARGSFIGQGPYTRLISYSRGQDLRSDNQLFGELPEDSTMAGFTTLTGTKRPFVYMGPGLWHTGPNGPDAVDDESGFGRIHIRMIPTTNNVPGFDDYDGPSDPRKIPLAIWTARIPTLKLSGCDFVHVTDLTIRHGTRAVRLQDCKEVQLDHVTVLAGPHGVDIAEGCDKCMLTNCVVDGGMPTWYFRSDRKDGYRFTTGDKILTNGLGEGTLRALLEGDPTITNTVIRQCEFVNGHDLLLFGAAMEFSRNWVFNLNDDAIFAETRGITDARIFENVIEQCLTGISFANRTAGNGVAVYRNLFDLRRPTLGRRPPIDPKAPEDPDNPKDPLRFGQLFKSNLPDGPLGLFHNTVVLKHQVGRVVFKHLNDAQPDDSECPQCPFMPRRSFNNVLVALDAPSDKPISWLPNPTWPAATDGNCYFRTGAFPDGLLFQHFAYRFPGAAVDVPRGEFPTLEALRASAIFEDSAILHPPGYEASSIATDPLFQNVPALADSAPQDDFRLGPGSPCRGGGVVLPADLRVLDGASPDEPPDIGCFRSGAPPLAVGVNRHLTFPTS